MEAAACCSIPIMWRTPKVCRKAVRCSYRQRQKGGIRSRSRDGNALPCIGGNGNAMRTALNLGDQVLRRTKRQVAQDRASLSRLIDDALGAEPHLRNGKCSVSRFWVDNFQTALYVPHCVWEESPSDSH